MSAKGGRGFFIHNAKKRKYEFIITKKELLKVVKRPHWEYNPTQKFIYILNLSTHTKYLMKNSS